jgi:hypothetical protein
MAGIQKTGKEAPGNRGTGKPKRNYSEAFERQKFKPGQSGNLAGRPGTKALTDEIKKLLDEFAKEKRLRIFEPVLKNPTYRRLLAKALILRAIENSDVAAKVVLDRVDGPVHVELEAESVPVKYIRVDMPRPDPNKPIRDVAPGMFPPIKNPPAKNEDEDVN